MRNMTNSERIAHRSASRHIAALIACGVMALIVISLSGCGGGGDDPPQDGRMTTQPVQCPVMGPCEVQV